MTGSSWILFLGDPFLVKGFVLEVVYRCMTMNRLLALNVLQSRFCDIHKLTDLVAIDPPSETTWT